MCTASSIGAPSRLRVTRLMPIPSVIEPLPVALSVPPRTYSYRLLPGGSASTQRMAGRRDLRDCATPANVPPVPVEAEGIDAPGGLSPDLGARGARKIGRAHL